MGVETKEKWRPRDENSELREARGSVGAEAPPPPHAQPKSQFELVLRDTEKSDFLDVMDCGGVATSVESIIVGSAALLNSSAVTNPLR